MMITDHSTRPTGRIPVVTPPRHNWPTPPSATRPPSLATVGVRNAEEARLVRGAAYQALEQIDHIHATYGGCLPIGDGEGDYSTRFLERWLQLVPELIVLYRLLSRLAPPETAAGEGIPW
jgi:hypothetical protein